MVNAHSVLESELAFRPAPPVRDETLVAADGTPLAAKLFSASGKARGAVVIVPAMGVGQRYYEPFARWLGEQGFHALTFDYRGSGASRQGSLRKVDADIVTWAEQDAQAALDAIAGVAGSLPITWLGHSLGGQILPFIRGRERIDQVITVAAGSGYWRDNAAPLKRRVRMFWWGFVPVMTPLFGYFPGKMLGMVGDLPKGVIRQWRKWCLDPDYAAGAEGPEVRMKYDAVTNPITSIAFEDDEMMSERSIVGLHALYRLAPRRMLRFKPEDLGRKKVGHFGAFRSTVEATLWSRHILPELAQR